MRSPQLLSAIEAAFSHEYTDFDAYVKDIAREHTIANMGQSIEDYAHDRDQPDKLISRAWSGFYNIAESQEMADGFDEEYRSWLKTAKKDAMRVKRAKLPLTLVNARKSFMNEEPFKK